MSVICVVGRLSGDWMDVVLRWVPRLGVEVEGPGRIWGDGRGLRAEEAARAIVKGLSERGGQVRGGVAAVPVSAWAAAANTESGDVAIVRAGADRVFLAPLPLAVLEMEESVRTLLEGAGVETCGDLAALTREAVEVRFGGDAVTFWRRARAEDERHLFRRPRPEPPHAALEFVDYVVTDPERLVFTANALLGPLCQDMTERGAHARQLTVTLPLANGETWTRTLRAARPTASRTTWLRLVRGLLERLSVPDAVAGIELRIDTTEAAAAIQGDLFDTGFGTAAGVEMALTRLLETQSDVVVRPEPRAHPLPEERAVFAAEDSVLELVGSARERRSEAVSPTWGRMDANGLTLQLLPEPRPVQVETIDRRDHVIPVRYRDDRWRPLVTAAGPERVSGGQWEDVYAREYFRCITGDGLMVWLFRDGREGRWYLQGWWD